MTQSTLTVEATEPTVVAECRRIPLNAGWRLRSVSPDELPDTMRMPWIPASVPGHVHVDLQRANVIADPLSGMHEVSVAWVDETDWIYETTFPTPDYGRSDVYLRFNGLDTIAEIELNGAPLAHADNMHIVHEFDVAHLLQPLGGDANTLRVTFRSAMQTGRKRQIEWNASGEPVMDRHWFLWAERAFVRKAQYMYGWDWGPVLASCGIWRPVELIVVPAARILDWRHSVRFGADGSATAHIEASVERAAGSSHSVLWAEFQIGAYSSDRVKIPIGAGAVSVGSDIRIPDALRWQPNGIGKPHLYPVRIEVEGCDSIGAEIGLRTIELRQDPDPDSTGSSFKFVVNGKDVFAKGANWIPSDSFPSQVYDIDPQQRTKRLIEMAAGAGMNMLRVWGGGLYESEEFYRACDRNGIMVWQDFAFACSYQPDKAQYASAVRREATEVVRRLRNHASLAMYCGENECHVPWFDLWQDRPGHFPGYAIFHDILPAVCAQEDPQRPYWPGSPYGGEDPNSPNVGDRHNWDAWHGGDWPRYAEDNSRFVSEFGFASSCFEATWRTVLTDAELDPQSEAMRWHDKTRLGYAKYLGMVERHMPPIKTVQDLIYFTQINQAEALRFGVEHFRSLKGRCWGTLIWQLNDLWPAHAWALIDSKLQPKAAWYAAKRFYAPVVVRMLTAADRLTVQVISDDVDVLGSLAIEMRTFDGELLWSDSRQITAIDNTPAKSHEFRVPITGHETDAYVHARFCTDGTKTEAFAFFSEPKEWRTPDPDLTWSVGDGNTGDPEIVIRSERFAAYVWIDCGESPICPADNFFHMQAGEERRVAVAPIRPEQNLDLSALSNLQVRHFDPSGSTH